MDQQPPQAPPPGADPPAPVPPVAPPPGAPTAQPAPPVQPAPQVQPAYWQGGGGQEAGPAPGVLFASYGTRFIAYVVDSFLIGLIVAALWIVLALVLGVTSSDGGVSAAGGFASIVLVGVIVIASVAYFPYFWQRSGQTPAMKWLGIRVVRDRDGGPVTWGSGILRFIGYTINSIVFGLPIGWLWPLWDKRHRGWHDLIGGTVVIKA
jgi:Mce-associated membrane protein